ncbi:MAG: hypothetical protein M3Z56_09225 [Bacteroidota bacterium]|nr:hypothetical protein [Bacteroidota bacterium]
MKLPKIFIVLLSFFIFHIITSKSFAISPVSAVNNTSVTRQHFSSADQLRIAQMRVFVNMSVEDYGKLKGKRLNFFERLSFKASQRRMRLMLKAYDGDGPTTFEKISWLIKGLLLGPIALYLATYF